jgi:hypothetical protein
MKSLRRWWTRYAYPALLFTSVPHLALLYRHRARSVKKTIPILKQIVDTISLQRTRQGYRNDARNLPGSIDLDAYSDDDQAGSWCNC